MPRGFASPQTPTTECSCAIYVAEFCPGKVHDSLSTTFQTVFSSNSLIISGDLFPFSVHGEPRPRAAGLADWRRSRSSDLSPGPLVLFTLKTTTVWLRAHRFWAVIWMALWSAGRRSPPFSDFRNNLGMVCALADIGLYCSHLHLTSFGWPFRSWMFGIIPNISGSLSSILLILLPVSQLAFPLSCFGNYQEPQGQSEDDHPDSGVPHLAKRPQTDALR